jgi:hypothetical protein
VIDLFFKDVYGIESFVVKKDLAILNKKLALQKKTSKKK